MKLIISALLGERLVPEETGVSELPWSFLNCFPTWQKALPSQRNLVTRCEVITYKALVLCLFLAGWKINGSSKGKTLESPNYTRVVIQELCK